MSCLLKASGLTATLGDTKVLDNVDLRLDVGQLVAVIGPNGAGKSSLLRAMLRLLPLRDGTVEISGQDVSSLRGQDIAGLVSYLPQGHIAHWPLDVETLVTLGRRQRHHLFEQLETDDLAAVKEAIAAVGLQKFTKRPLDKLSGGERARAFIARALASKAPILFADEPVAALDPRHQLQVMELLRAQCHEKNMAIVTVLHDLFLATEYCDAFLLMTAGQARFFTKAELSTMLIHIEEGFGVKMRDVGRGAYMPTHVI